MTFEGLNFNIYDKCEKNHSTIFAGKRIVLFINTSTADHLSPADPLEESEVHTPEKKK